jgi:hypothetical protein
MGQPQKKGRTMKLTIDELLESERFWLGVQAYLKGDKSYLEAILIELGLEIQNVTKYTLARVYGKHYSLDKKELAPLLKSWDDFTTYNIWWRLTEDERRMIEADIAGHKEEYQKYLKQVRLRLMGE